MCCKGLNTLDSFWRRTCVQVVLQQFSRVYCTLLTPVYCGLESSSDAVFDQRSAARFCQTFPVAMPREAAVPMDSLTARAATASTRRNPIPTGPTGSFSCLKKSQGSSTPQLPIKKKSSILLPNREYDSQLGYIVGLGVGLSFGVFGHGFLVWSLGFVGACIVGFAVSGVSEISLCIEVERGRCSEYYPLERPCVSLACHRAFSCRDVEPTQGEPTQLIDP